MLATGNRGQGPRDRRIVARHAPATPIVIAVGRPASTSPDVEETARHARGERADQGRRRCATPTGHARDRRRHRPRDRRARRRARRLLGALRRRATPTYADNVAKLLDGSTACRPPDRTARFATVVVARWPDGRRARRRGEVEGASSRRGARLAEAASATTRCSCRSKATVGRSRRWHRTRSTRSRTAAGRSVRSGRRPAGHGRSRSSARGARYPLTRWPSSTSPDSSPISRITRSSTGSTCTTSATSSSPTRCARRGRSTSTPKKGCEGPVDLYLSLEIDPRVLLGFEDAVIGAATTTTARRQFHFPLNFTWALPPLAERARPARARDRAGRRRRSRPARSRCRRPTRIPVGDRRARAHAAHRRPPAGVAACASATAKRCRARCSTAASA